MVGDGGPTVILMIFLFYFVSRTSRSRDTGVFRRSEWKWQKEHKRKRSQILQATPHFWVACKFLFSYMEKCIGAIFWTFFRNHRKPGTPWKHPEKAVSFKKRAERGWKSGARSLSWKSGWKPSTIREFWHQRIFGSFFRFRDTAIWKLSRVQINFQ